MPFSRRSTIREVPRFFHIEPFAPKHKMARKIALWGINPCNLLIFIIICDGEESETLEK